MQHATDETLEDQIIIDLVKHSADRAILGLTSFPDINPKMSEAEFKYYPDRIKKLLKAIAGNGELYNLHYYELANILEDVGRYKNRMPGKSFYKLINDKCNQLVDQASRISLTIGNDFLNN